MDSRRMRHILLVAIALGGTFGWLPERAEAVQIEMVADPQFQQGFTVKAPSGEVEGTIAPAGDQSPPVWTIAQWHSGTSVFRADQATYQGGAWRFQNEHKRLHVRPGEGRGDLVLGINGFAEYGGKYRRHGDPWPHLFLSQRISSPGGHLGRRSPSLAAMKKLDFSIDVKLLSHDAHATAQRDPRIHAAQFLVFFTVQNLNPDSAARGDYYWFGVCLFDDREKVTRHHVLVDKGQARKKGTGKLIYTLGVESFGRPDVASGQWVTVRGDLYPHMVAGLEAAWERDFLLDSRRLEDYYVGGLVIGFEVTGLNDIEMAVRDLRATAEVVAPRESR